MDYRPLGKTGLQVSTISLGAWEIGGAVELNFPSIGTIPHGWGTTDDRASIDLIHRCGEAGVNFIDTAPIYGAGHSEEVIGQALADCRDDWIVCTKGGHGAVAGGESWYDFSRQRLLSQLDESLDRLQMDHVDVYLLHGPKPGDLEAGECLDAMDEMKRQGKARFTGVSLGPNPMGVALMRQGRVDVLQQAISLVNPAAARDLLPVAVEENVGIVARGVFGHGFLTGAINADSSFQPDDRRSWQDEDSKRDLAQKAEQLRSLTGKQRSLAQLALQYVLQMQGVSTIIAGTSNWTHMQENIAAVDVPRLTAEELLFIAGLQA